MPHLINKILVCLALVAASACSETSNDVLVAVLKTENDAIAFQSRLSEAGGALAAPMLRNDGQLLNDALPENTTDLDGGFVSISRFEDRQAQQNFVAQEINATKASFLAEGRTVGWLPFIGQPLGQDSLGAARAPAFALVNFIDQRPMVNPVNATRMINYMSTTTPLLRENGVNFIAPVLFESVLRGRAETDLLFLTTWPSRAAFDSVHSDPAFIANARANRNRVFQGFTENQAGVVTNDLSE